MTSALSSRSRAVIASYARRNAWCDIRDLEQEAHAAALTAPPEWQHRAVALALSRFVVAAKLPVTVPAYAPSRVWEIADSISSAPEDDCDEAAPSISPEEQLDLARAAARVRAILDEMSEAARLVLLEEEKSASVARRLGLSYRRVTDLTAAARAALREAFAGELEAVT